MPNLEHFPVDQVTLDVQNPRIAKYIEIYGDEITAERMALALGAGSGEEGAGGPSFSSLKQSIQTNRGIIHPIILNRESSEKAVVIEGNTRTLIYKEFKDKGVEGDWENIPAMVYENMTHEMINAIRLQAHLVGTRQWDPYSKAKYLDYLRNTEHLTFSQMVDFCGGARREVENYIQAYNDMEKYYRDVLESDQDFDPTRFSAFVELQNPRITQAIAQASFDKTDFSRWVNDRKLYPLNTVRKLPQILSNERSKGEFLKKGAAAAIRVLEVPTEDASLKDATIFQLAREISKRINRMQFDHIRKLRESGETEEREILFDATDQLSDLRKELEPREEAE